MKAKEIREMPVDELKRKAKELTENQFNLRIRHKTGQLDSTADLNRGRKDLARVMTVLGQKAKAAAPSASDVKEKEAAK